MTDTPELPKLPESFPDVLRYGWILYTGGQMHAYLLADRSARAEPQSGYYLWEYPKHPSRVARPEDADFAKGEPLWVRCYPVEVFGGAEWSDRTAEAQAERDAAREERDELLKDAAQLRAALEKLEDAASFAAIHDKTEHAAVRDALAIARAALTTKDTQ